MGKDDDDKNQRDAEEKLQEKASKVPHPTSVKKPDPKPVKKSDSASVKRPDGGSAMTREEVKTIVATKLDKMETKQAEYAASVEKKQDEFQILLNRMSSNIAKLVPSDKGDEQASKESFQTSFQNESILEEQSDDNCTDEEIYEEPSLVNKLQPFKISRRIKPTDLVVDAWAKSRKLTEEYQEEDWKKSAEDTTIKNYTMHPAASSFKAPDADSECPELYHDKKELEKKLVLLQNMAGAVGHLCSEVLVSCDAEINNLNEVIKEYRDPNSIIENP